MSSLLNNKLNMLENIRMDHDTIYSDQGMRNVFEDHLTWLQSRCGMHLVEKQFSYVFEYDLYGYLDHVLHVPLKLHWLYMRVNNMISPTEFTQHTQSLLIPKEEDIDKLLGEYELFMS